MNSQKNINDLEEFYQQSLGWRDSLLVVMNAKSADEINCFSCTGECCTFSYNSMRVTPLEGITLYLYLVKNDRWDAALEEKLRSTIKYYRLDVPLPGNGSRFFIRRGYTCPFYTEGAKGCSISPSNKPYGCLAYNPTKKDSKGAGSCYSQQDELEAVENNNKDQFQEWADRLSTFIDFSWDKLPMPVALLDLHEKLAPILNQGEK